MLNCDIRQVNPEVEGSDMREKVKRIHKLIIKAPDELKGFSYWSDEVLMRNAVANDPRIEDFVVETFAGEGAEYGRRTVA